MITVIVATVAFAVGFGAGGWSMQNRFKKFLRITHNHGW